MYLNAYWRNGGIENNAISGIDMAFELLKIAEARNLSVFLLGGKPTVAQRAAEKLKSELEGRKSEWEKNNTKEEVDVMVEKLRKIVKKLRSISAIRIYKNKVEL